jgi:transposase-like protein
MTAVFQNPIFQDEAKAREALEAVRWPDGPYCPHCGNSDQDKIAKVEGKKQSHRPGLYYCNECKGQFTVTVGTVFERSKVPLTKWWMAAHLFNQGKNGASAHEMHRQLGVTYKTAWFMMHRLREAMVELNPAPMGGEQHLQRYLNEFAFRYSNRSGLGITDGERTARTMQGIEGKRLAYRPARYDQE